LNAIDDSIKRAELALAEERQNAAEERRLLQDFTLLSLQPAATTSAPQPLDRKSSTLPKLEALKQELARLRARIQNATSLLSSQRMRDLFGVLREQYDFILLDAPPILPLSDMNIFEKVVDGVMMVVRAESTSKDALMRALNTMGTDKVLGIVLNDVHHAPFSYYRYNSKYNYKYKTDSN